MTRIRACTNIGNSASKTSLLGLAGPAAANSSRTRVEQCDGPLVDARDFDGNVPSSLGSSIVEMDFLWCPTNVGLGGSGSTLTDPGASIQIQDSAGANYFEIGSYGPGEAISYRVAGGTWIDAGFPSGPLLVIQGQCLFEVLAKVHKPAFDLLAPLAC